MLKELIGIVVFAGMVSLAGCSTVPDASSETPEREVAQAEAETLKGETDGTEKTPEQKGAEPEDEQSGDGQAGDAATQDKSKSIVVYYSRTGDNYSVGNIEVGNTAKIALEIVKQTGADRFEIVPEKAYPAVYKACTEVAQEETNANARPKSATTLEHFEQYDTVYLGYPIWWGDMPMVVYTFIESYDFDNKTVIPFNTHEGSGQAGTWGNLRKALPKATVKDGLVMTGSTAQNDPDEVARQVKALLQKD